MTFNFQSDYSYLFSSLGTSSSSGLGNLNFLSDYMSIKNGSYGKLLKAYYSQSSSDSSTSSTSSSSSSNFINQLTNRKKIDIEELVGSNKSSSTSSSTSTSTSKDSSATLADIKSKASALKESVNTLFGADSPLNEQVIETEDDDGNTSTVYDVDVNAAYKSIKDFVKNYNALLQSAGGANSATIQKYLSSMIEETKANADALSKIGITINDDNTLSIDKSTFKASDMSTVKSLFSGYGSYAYRVSSSASFIGYAADRDLGRANTYNSSGSYSNNYSSGSIYSSYY